MSNLEHNLTAASSVTTNETTALSSPSVPGGLDPGSSTVSAVASKLDVNVSDVNGKVDVHSIHSHFSQHRHSLTEAANLKNDNEQRNHQNEQTHSEGDSSQAANFQANLADESAFELKLFVGQIPPDVSLDSLRALFENYGEVSNIYVLRDKITSRSRGCAFISYKNKNCADAAIAALHDRFKLPNAKRELIVKYADSQQPYSGSQNTPNGSAANAQAGAGAFDPRRRLTLEGRGSTKGKFRSEFGHHPNSSSTSQLQFGGGHQQNNSTGNSNGGGFSQTGQGFYGGYSEGDGSDHAFNTINSHSPSSSFHNASDDSQASSPDNKDDEFKLYVSHLSRTTSDNDVRSLFANYGDVREVFLLRDLKQSGHPFKGIAFVKMSSYQSAQHAIDALNHQYHDQGMTTPINVRFAFSKEAKNAFQTQKQQQQAWLAMQQQYSAMQPYAAIYGGMHAAAAFPHAAAMGALAPTSFQPFAANGSNTNSNAASSGVAALSGGLTNLHLNASGHASASPHGGSGHPFSAILPSNSVAGKDSKGPEGANLFVYGLPEQVNDNELLAMFTPFGHLISVRVHRDLTTGLSRGFGFVSYDQPHSAQQAIAGMDGIMYGNKKLTVRLKKGEEYGVTTSGQQQTQHQPNQANAAAHSVLNHAHGHHHTPHAQHAQSHHPVHSHSLQQQHVHALSQFQAASAQSTNPAAHAAAAAALAHHPLSLAASMNQSGVNAVNAAAASHAQQVLHSHLQAQAAQVQAAAVQQAQAAQAAQAHALAQAQAHSNSSFALSIHQPHSPTAAFQPFKY